MTESPRRLQTFILQEEAKFLPETKKK